MHPFSHLSGFKESTVFAVGGERVGAVQKHRLRKLAKALGSGIYVRFVQILIICGAVSLTDAVIPREISPSLGAENGIPCGVGDGEYILCVLGEACDLRADCVKP